VAEQWIIQHADTLGRDVRVPLVGILATLTSAWHVAGGVRVTKMITNDSRTVCAVFCQGSGRAPHIS